MRRCRSATFATDLAPRRRRAVRAVAGLVVATASAGASAQAVSLSGSFSDKALLVIDGVPRTLAVGAAARGVRLLEVRGGDAVVEIKGERVTLAMGGSPVSVGGHGEAGGQDIVMVAGSGGHFVASGAINGHAARFLVDTGATNVAISRATAETLGVDLKSARTGWSQTANGAVPVHDVTLTSVRIGDVTVYQVRATVVAAPMDDVLLGNSFLTRFQMKRENDVMTLVKRP